MDNIRVKKESLNNWRDEFEIEEGLVTTGLALSAAGGLASWGLGKAKKYVNKKLDDASKNTKIGGQYRKKQIETNSGVKLEQIEGGISVQNYADGVQFNEIETVDIIKAEPLDASNWRSDLEENLGIKMPTVRPGQFTSTGGKGKAVPLPEVEDEKLKSTGGKGKAVPLPKVKPGQFTEEIVDEGKTSRYRGFDVGGSGNKDALHRGTNEKIIHNVTGVNYRLMVKNKDKKKEVVSASHEVEGDFIDEGLVRGALQGAGLLWKLGKWGIPKAARALKNKGAADITKFKKSQEVVRRVNNIEKIRTTNALKGTDVKGVFTKSKVKPELNKINWKSTVPKTTPTTSTTSTKRLTSSRPHLDHPTSKGLTYQQKQSKATNIIAKIRGNTPTQQKSKEVLSRMNNAINKSNKPGTYSSKVNAAKNIPDPVTSIVPSPSGSLTKITKSSSALVSNRPPKIRPQNKLTGVDLKGLLKSTEKAIPVKPKTNIQRPSGKPAPKPEWGGPRRAPEPEWGTGTPPRSKRAHQAPEPAWGEPKLKDRLTKSSVWPVNKSVSATTGLVAGIVKGSSSTNNSKIAKSDTIENPEITKDKKDKEKSNWLERTRNTAAAKVFSDDERWETQQKYRKWKADRKKKKEVNEGAVAALKVASKIPWGKVAGAAMTAIGGTGVLKTTRKDALPDGDPPADIQKQMDADKSIDVPGIPMGNPDLEHHHGTKDKPKGMKDKYDKDALDNAKTDNILDPTGTQKTKPTLEQLRKHKDAKQKKKYKPKFNPRQNMTDKQIIRMQNAGLLPKTK